VDSKATSPGRESLDGTVGAVQAQGAGGRDAQAASPGHESLDGTLGAVQAQGAVRALRQANCLIVLCVICNHSFVTCEYGVCGYIPWSGYYYIP
jgi:hypothetical protein